VRVAYVHTGTWPSPSPSTTFVTYNAAALAEVCGGCTLYVRSGGGFPPARVLREGFGMEMPGGLRVEAIRRLLGFTNRLFLGRAERLVRREHGSRGLDAVITRNVTFLPRLVRLRRELGVPVIFESHDFHADISRRDDGGSARRQRLERKWLPGVSSLVCLHSRQAKLYRDVFPGLRIDVAGTGAPEPAPRKSPGDRLAYVGSLDPHKGLGLLLRAVESSRHRPPLLVAGGKSPREVEAFRARASRLAPNVELEVTGWLDKPGLSRCLAGAAAGVLPLRDTFFNRNLTSPLKLFDYYAHGIPVIAADLPALRELVDEGGTGLFFPPGDPAALAAAIDRLWSDGALRESMSRQALLCARRRLWSRRAERLAGLVRELEAG
jgi:glycosyltransferase involved in cell wall biosynthesis